MKLQHKVMLTYTTLISCSLILISVLAVFSYQNILSSLTSSLSTQLFSSKSNEISSWLNSRISEIQIISESSCVKEMKEDEVIEYVDHLNQTIGTQYGNPWGTFAIGSTDGIGYVGLNKTIDISNRPYFIEGLSTSEEYLFSNPVLSKTDNSVITILHYPLRNEQGYYGFINAAINLHHLTDIVSNIDFYEGESFIMDTSSNLYTKVQTISAQDTENIMNNVMLHLDTTSSFSLDKYTYYYTKIPANENWYLCTKVETANLTKETSSFILMLTSLLVLFTLITIVVCIYLSRSITKPISNLNETMQKASSNLQIVADQSDIEEINSLSYSFNQLIQKIDNLLKKIKEDAKLQRQSEIKVLQAQINPHFLYNTLDALNWKALQHQDTEMTTLIRSLCDFYRISLSNGDEFIPIKDEIKHVECYLKIQSIRFKNQFTYDLEVEPHLLSMYCLKILLQPLIENAITHGLRPLDHPGEIHIRIFTQENNIIMTVEDNGVGMSDQILDEVNNGLSNQALHKYGLYNINQRIRLTYGETYGIHIQSQLNSGTKVTVTIPQIKVEM
ncbi:MAG: sensor histidine kinase [Erysipelotrichaceae bacterium]|nr:sensor histidine kinase [Erysipelotrichaceae bacterium]